MPVYEYECQSCKEITETWQGISDEPLAICPSCSGPLKKIISVSTFALKGGGWYADGYNRVPQLPAKVKAARLNPRKSAVKAKAPLAAPVKPKFIYQIQKKARPGNGSRFFYPPKYLCRISSDNRHRIAITVKAITLPHRMIIRSQQPFPAGQGADHKQQG